MQIGKILFPVTTLGPGERLGIWVQGCNRFCEGCSNPELQTFDQSKDVSPKEIFKATSNMGFEGITVSGGEPFLQAKDLKELIQSYNEIGYDDILVYTGFTLEQLLDKNDDDINYILSHVAVLIDGPFISELVDDIPLRGSSNQNVWIFNPKYKDAYEKILTQEKRVDIFYFGDDIHFIGIPFKNHDSLYKKLLSNRRRK